MPLFPSAEWMDAYCDALATHPEAGRAARALDGVYRFEVDPAGPVADRHTYDVAIRPRGDGAHVERLEDGADPRLTMRANYDRWRQLIRGELDLKKALLLRRLKISGDLAALTQHMDDARPLTAALQQVDTQWRG